MKHILALAALTLPLFASADVKRPGEFVPSACSPHEENVRNAVIRLSSVCFGRIEGRNDGMKAIEIRSTSGDVLLYRVKLDGQLGGLGKSTAAFEGKRINQKSRERLDEIDGEISMINGVRRSYQLSLRTFSGYSYSGPLETVAVPQ